MIDENLTEDYPQMETFMGIYLAISATSVQTERSFSVLKRLSKEIQ